MALNKAITNFNGIVTSYHMIYNIAYNIDQSYIEVSLKSYVDDSYRQKEKDLAFYAQQRTAVLSEINNIEQQLANEENIINEEELINTRNQYLTELEEITILFNEHNRNFGISIDKVKLNISKDEPLSFSYIYSLLKETERYAGATDC